MNETFLMFEVMTELRKSILIYAYEFGNGMFLVNKWRCCAAFFIICVFDETGHG
jgi:hypothetical protein